MVSMKLVSCLEKCFLDQTPEDFPAIERLRMYRNEQASLQILAYNGDEAEEACSWFTVEVDGVPADCVTVRSVESVPNYLPAYSTPKTLSELDPHFVRTTPGLYPDILMSATHGGRFPLINQQLHPLWVDIRPNDAIAPGTYPTVIRLLRINGDVLVEQPIELTVLPALLPAQDTRVTNWFYADCLADYYGVESFSDRHFEICENFIKTAVDNGINMILMPVFTPPLDTARNGERTTTQLVGVTVENGKYTFDFTLAERWLDMCDRVGVKYIEVAHLFTQWGAYHAPKVMATVDGEYKRIFGWDTDAAGEEYVTFLLQFLAEFTAFLEKRGDKERTYFHISDEPNDQHIEQYKTNRENVLKVLKDWKILDALSHIEYYHQGLCEIPVAYTKNLHAFLPEDIKERWTYYCCGPTYHYSNRFIAGSLPRVRSLGMQMYKYGIEGFLHWGYNFYNNQFSEDVINPYMNMTAGYWGIGGDAAVVYPGHGGVAIESIRLLAFRQAFDDIRVMKLCESYYGKERVVAEIEAIAGTVVFEKCVEDSVTMQRVRDRLDDLILEAM